MNRNDLNLFAMKDWVPALIILYIIFLLSQLFIVGYGIYRLVMWLVGLI